MTKKAILCGIVILMLLAGIAYAGEQEYTYVNAAGKVIESIYRIFLKMTLPESLDQVYTGSTPGVLGNAYLGEMFKLGGMMFGIVVNVQDGDFTRAMIFYQAFSAQYDNVSTMVPEWKKYFDKKLVARIGKDIENRDVDKTMQDIKQLGENVCAECHRNSKPQVWIKYYWRDFRSVNISTPIGNRSWSDAKLMFVTPAFDGAPILLEEGKRNQANNSADLFRLMYNVNMVEACKTCHGPEPRRYYVSSDVAGLVDQYVEKIKAGDVAGARALQGAIGEQCMRCHITHEGQQRMKEMMD